MLYYVLKFVLHAYRVEILGLFIAVVYLTSSLGSGFFGVNRGKARSQVSTLGVSEHAMYK